MTHFGVKELVLVNTPKLKKSSILVALTDSPSKPTSPVKETQTKEIPTEVAPPTPITPTRGRHSEPEISVTKKVRKRDRFLRHSADSTALSVFYIDTPATESTTENTLVEETDSGEVMDNINPEFQERIQAIENDSELQAKVNFALDNWIGTRYNNYLKTRHQSR